MKKLFTAFVAAVTVMAMTVTAFGAQSPVNNGAVTGSTTEGVEVKATTQAAPADPTAVAGLSAESKKVLASDNSELYSLVDITAPAGTSEVTLKVTGVTADTKVVVLHFENNAWTEVKATVANGTITISGLKSFSPFAIYVDKTTVASSDATTPATPAAPGKSDKTGESAAVACAAIIALAAAVASVEVYRKKRA